MPNQRISELPESGPLYFNDVPFNSIYTESSSVEASSDWFLMTARPKVSNEKISFPNFHRSVLSDAVYLNTNQTISGQKTFTDKCYITKRANVTSIQDPTSSGDLSGIGFIGTTGLFENLLAGTGESGNAGCDVTVFDSALFEGDMIIGGTISFPGEFSTDDFSTLDLRVTSGTQIMNGVSSTGASSFSHDIDISGDTMIDGSISTSGDLSVHENIFSNYNQTLQFTPDHIQITNDTNNFIDITADNIKYKQIINVNESNVVNLSDSTPSGVFHVDGTGYVQNINALNNGTYRQFFGGDDESMVFKSQLQSGFREFTIDLPKTFLETPVISPNLQHVSGGFIIPYIISDVTNKDYKIKFGEDTNDHDFVLHTTAMSPSTGQYSTNKNGIQRFRSTIPSGTTSQQINFPQAHNLKPTVSIAIEAQNEIVPYTISGVNTNNYTIFLAAESTEDYVLHTISTEYDNQRIS